MGAAVGVWLAGLLPVLAVHAVAYSLVPFKSAVMSGTVGVLLMTPLGRRVMHRQFGGGLKWLGWFLLAWWFSAAWASLDGVWPTGALPMVAFVVLVLMAKEVFWEQGARLFGLWRATGTALAALALLQVLGFDPLYTVTSKARAVATLGNTNAYAAVAAPLLALAVAHAATHARSRASDLLPVVLLAASLVACGGKGGGLAAGAGLAVVVVARARQGHWARARRPVLATGAGVLLGVVVVVVPAFGPHAPDHPPAPTGEAAPAPDADQGPSAGGTSFTVRWEVLKASWHQFLDAPWLGTGPGSFAATHPLFRSEQEALTPSMGAESVVDHPHNEGLRLATEGGLVATVLLLGAFLGGLRCLRHATAPPTDDPPPRPAPLVLAAGLVAFAVSAATWSSLWDPAPAALAATLLGSALAWRMEADALPKWVATGKVLRLVTALVLVGSAAPVIAGELCQARAVWKPLRHPTRLGQTSAEVAASLEQVVSGLVRAASWDRLTFERQSIAGQLLLDYARHRRGEVGAEWRDAARTCLQRAERLHPWDDATLLGLAELEVAEGKGARALDWLRRRHKAAPWTGDPIPVCLDLARTSPRVAEVAISVGKRRGPSSWPALRQLAEDLRANQQPRDAARILDSFSDRVGADIEYYQFLGRCLRELGDENGHFDAMYKMQLACAVESLRLQEWETAQGNLTRAARYRREQGEAAEQLLEAVRLLGTGDAPAAEAALRGIPKESLSAVPDWVLGELDPLRKDDDCRAALRSLGISTARD